MNLSFDLSDFLKLIIIDYWQRIVRCGNLWLNLVHTAVLHSSVRLPADNNNNKKPNHSTTILNEHI